MDGEVLHVLGFGGATCALYLRNIDPGLGISRSLLLPVSILREARARWGWTVHLLTVPLVAGSPERVLAGCGPVRAVCSSVRCGTVTGARCRVASRREARPSLHPLPRLARQPCQHALL